MPELASSPDGPAPPAALPAARREVCPRCRRPLVVCYCAHLQPLPTRTRVVFLQHPREARVPIGTARMAHLMLPNSEIHLGVSFEHTPAVQRLLLDPGAALLFPGEGATDPGALPEGAVSTLLVIDGTWSQARQVLRRNPFLSRLPRLGLVPAQPGNYRIRREPAADCLATIEAVSQVLGTLERDPPRFSSMLAAFTYMVDQQIARAAARLGPRRRLDPERQRQSAARMRARLMRVVVLHAEVNGHPRWSATPGRPELLHVCAQRVATGERFEAILAPRRPLAVSAPGHLGLSRAALLSGEPVAAALQRLHDFLRPEDLLCGWGSYARDALAADGAHVDERRFAALRATDDWLDLRGVIADRLQRAPGTPLQACQHLGVPPPTSASGGRAGQCVAILAALVTALLTAPWHIVSPIVSPIDR